MSKTIKNCQKPEILKSFKKEFHFQNQHHKTLGNTINIDKKRAHQNPRISKFQSWSRGSFWIFQVLFGIPQGTLDMKTSKSF